jgi:hypothetical protein
MNVRVFKVWIIARCNRDRSFVQSPLKPAHAPDTVAPTSADLLHSYQVDDGKVDEDCTNELGYAGELRSGRC